jgi:hypothetical protein
MKMSWDCPRCGRSFKVRNQPHSCGVTDVAHHFSRKDPVIRAIYDKIIGALNPCGPVNISFVKNAIIVSAKSTFLAVKPRRTYVDIEFLLNGEILDFPIHKTFRVSKNKVAHFVKIGSPDEVEGAVAGWLQQAYRINAGKL